jgi:sugar lactone lactonase YvrE
VSAFAGRDAGFLNETGLDAQFSLPIGLAVDAAGNLYVADSGNHAIRKITPAGLVSTLAGGSRGFVNGTGNQARFDAPNGIAIDSTGNLYVADSGNHAIRKVTPAGVVSTFSGDTAGNTGASLGQYNSPDSIVIDGSNNLYVTDTNNRRIVTLSNTGTATLFAGSGTLGLVDGSGPAASFFNPKSITRDGTGTMWVADDFVIRKISPAGAVTTPNLTGANFTRPILAGGSAGGSEFIYAADAGKHTVYRIDITATGLEATAIAGGVNLTGTANGTGTNARFNQPEGLVLTPSGKLYISDTANHRIRQIQ